MTVVNEGTKHEEWRCECGTHRISGKEYSYVYANVSFLDHEAAIRNSVRWLRRNGCHDGSIESFLAWGRKHGCGVT